MGKSCLNQTSVEFGHNSMDSIIKKIKDTSIVLGVTGKAGTGKDKFSHLLEDNIDKNCFHVKRFAFADPVKEVCSLLFKHPINNFYNQDSKDKLIPAFNLSVREAMQKFGTDLVRNNLDKDHWIKYMALNMYERLNIIGNTFTDDDDYLNRGNLFILTDIRFDNEASFVKQCGGKIIKIKRENHNSMKHESEAGIADSYIDYVIDNNSSLIELNRLSRRFANKYGLR